ncbi:MAG: SDR family oxidoreductase [Rhizobiales bacterium]|nr:SDR family oxidoreductase [Hyphomicrobiales bacterium]
MPTPRSAFVTGTSTGLGRAIALALARAGYGLALSELDTGWLKDLLAHPDMAARKVVPVALDLRVEASIRAAYAAAREGLGAIDLLVNNAGRALLKPVVDVAWSDWDDVIGTNLKGAYFLSQEYARDCLAQRRPGCIVSLASTHGMTGLENRSVYGISKGGIIQMTRMLAIEWAKHDIRVNAIAPTTVLTPSRERLLSDPKRREAMLARIPTGRFATEDEIAGAVIYLASPAAASITGHTLPIDGGLTAY